MDKKLRLIAAMIGVSALGLLVPVKAYAHGAHIEYSSNVEIEIVAKYDTGGPMGGAQVVIYAPDDATTPWLTGVCDDEGRFSFVPDTSKPGTWDIQVRQAGHGDIIHIPVGEAATTTASTGGYSYVQIGVMVACVVWGSVGTALYFSRRRKS